MGETHKYECLNFHHSGRCGHIFRLMAEAGYAHFCYLLSNAFQVKKVKKKLNKNSHQQYVLIRDCIVVGWSMRIVVASLSRRNKCAQFAFDSLIYHNDNYCHRCHHYRWMNLRNTYVSSVDRFFFYEHVAGRIQGRNWYDDEMSIVQSKKGFFVHCIEIFQASLKRPRNISADLHVSSNDALEEIRDALCKIRSDEQSCKKPKKFATYELLTQQSWLFHSFITELWIHSP